MENKKAKWFLWICLTLFALSVIAFAIYIVAAYYKVEDAFPYDEKMVWIAQGMIVIEIILMIIPGFGSELSFIRSIYHILKHRPKGAVNICYIISACLACFAFVFLWLIKTRLIRIVAEDGLNYGGYILIYTQWPFFIVSFLLGSVPVKRKEPCNN